MPFIEIAQMCLHYVLLTGKVFAFENRVTEIIQPFTYLWKIKYTQLTLMELITFL